MRSQVTYAEKQVWRDAAAMDDMKNHFQGEGRGEGARGAGEEGCQGEGENSGRSDLVLQRTPKTNLKRMSVMYGLSNGNVCHYGSTGRVSL